MSAVELARRLPEIKTIAVWARALAVLDAIMSPDAAMRYFSYKPARGTDSIMAKMDNGSGDQWSLVVSPAGAYLRCFDHESPVSPFGREPVAVWPNLINAVPGALRQHALDPAWQLQGIPLITASLWREPIDESWHSAGAEVPEQLVAGCTDPDGVALCDQLGGDADTYVRFAAEYYERHIDPRIVGDIYRSRPLSANATRRLNPDIDWTDLRAEVASLGYPVTTRD